MPEIKLTLHNNDGIYTLDKIPVENSQETRIQDIAGVAIKMNGDGKLDINKGRINHPKLSTKILLEKAGVSYVESITIKPGQDNTVMELVGHDDYRQLRGQQEFYYNLKRTWIALHVVKEIEGGDPVFYLVVNATLV